MVFINLETSDLEILGIEYYEVSRYIDACSREDQGLLGSVGERLHTIAWIMEQFHKNPPHGDRAKHDILSQLIYMLLSCGDNLGRHWVPSVGPGGRFRAFFRNLPLLAKDRLLNAFVIERLTLPIPTSYQASSIATILSQRNSTSISVLVAEVEDCFYAWRNASTHDSGSPDHSIMFSNLAAAYRGDRVYTSGYPLLIHWDRQSGNPSQMFRLFINTDDPIGDLRATVIYSIKEILGL